MGRLIPATQEHKKKALLRALAQCLGNVSDACREANVSRSTFYKYLDEDGDFRAQVEQVSTDSLEAALDIAESQLVQAMKEGKLTAILFFLRSKGHRRGYTQNQSEGSDEGSFSAINFSVNGSKSKLAGQA